MLAVDFLATLTYIRKANMANIFGGTEPPRWLQERALRPIPNFGSIAGTALAGGLLSLTAGKDENGQDVKKSFLQGIGEARMNQQDPMWMLKAQTERAAIASRMAAAENAYSAAWLREKNAVDWMADVPAITKIMSLSPEDVANADVGTLRTPQAVKLVDNIKKTASLNQSRSLSQKVAIGDAATFTKRLAALSPESRAQIQGMSKNADGTPTAVAWQTLGVAEQREQLRKQEELKAAAATASQQGLVPSGMTTTSDGKVSTRYSLPGTDSDSLYAQPPEVLTVDGYTFLKYGKQLRQLPSDNAEQKVRVSIAESKVKKAWEAWIKEPDNESLKTASDNATKELNALFGPEPMPEPAPEPTPEPEPATNSIRVLSITPAP